MIEKVSISTDRKLLDIDFIHDYMVNTSYWAKNRSLQETKKTIENSLCFGMYVPSGVQIGFARIVTDFVFFGNIMDVVIAPGYQRKGLGKMFMDYILKHDSISDLQTITLKTRDAHTFYERYGFTRVGDSPLYMSLDRQKLE